MGAGDCRELAAHEGVSVTDRAYPVPADDDARVAALRALRVLDAGPDRSLEDIVALAALVCGTPIAVITLIDAQRQQYLAATGIARAETPRDEAFCNHAIVSPDEVLVVEDTAGDERFALLPAVVGEPHVRAYAGAPLVTSTGAALGTVCVLDARSRSFTVEQRQALRTLSRLAVAHIELREALGELEGEVLEQGAHLEQLQQYQRELEEARSTAALQSQTDELTGLGNRRGLRSWLAEEVERARRYGTECSVLMIDIDQFKAVNDEHGHLVGDEVVRAVAERVRADLRPLDYVARFGGDEFIAVLPTTGAVGARILAERLRRNIAAAVWPYGDITLSIGVAALTDSMETVRDLIAAADAALYVSKREGRNRVTVAGEVPGHGEDDGRHDQRDPGGASGSGD